MKKLLTLLTFVSLCIIAALIVLFATDNLQTLLWVKYLFLFNCLIVFASLYFRYGKRTVFDDLIFNLKRVLKVLGKINFHHSEKYISLQILRIKNYLAFAQRFLEQIILDSDLYDLQKHDNELKRISGIITKESISDFKANQSAYILNISSALYAVSAENEKKRQLELAIRKAKKESSKKK